MLLNVGRVYVYTMGDESNGHFPLCNNGFDERSSVLDASLMSAQSHRYQPQTAITSSTNLYGVLTEFI